MEGLHPRPFRGLPRRGGRLAIRVPVFGGLLTCKQQRFIRIFFSIHLLNSQNIKQTKSSLFWFSSTSCMYIYCLKLILAQYISTTHGKFFTIYQAAFKNSMKYMYINLIYFMKQHFFHDIMNCNFFANLFLDLQQHTTYWGSWCLQF